jgi:hypothetical protein
MSFCTPGGRKWIFNPLYLNICYSRLGDSKRNLWVGIVFFVKIVEMLGRLGELMYICNSLDSV